MFLRISKVLDKYGTMTAMYLDLDGKGIGGGSFDGEPEDRNAERDLDWVLPAFEKLAEEIGISVEITTEPNPRA